MKKCIWGVLFGLLFNNCFGQKQQNDYITFYNYISEASYYFHEGNIDSTIYYFENGFDFVDEIPPFILDKYLEILWKEGKQELAIEKVKTYSIYPLDSIRFPGLPQKEYKAINLIVNDNFKRNRDRLQFYQTFIDSLANIDEEIRQISYVNDSIKRIRVMQQDSLNALELIDFTKKFGFPEGKNTGWDFDIEKIVFHLKSEWFKMFRS